MRESAQSFVTAFDRIDEEQEEDQDEQLLRVSPL